MKNIEYTCKKCNYYNDGDEYFISFNMDVNIPVDRDIIKEDICELEIKIDTHIRELANHEDIVPGGIMEVEHNHIKLFNDKTGREIDAEEVIKYNKSR